MHFCVLGSGSKGNSTYLADGNTAILIDAGFSGIEMERRLASIGADISSLSAVIITHEHEDHIRGVSVISRRHNLPVYANRATLRNAGRPLNDLFAFHEFSTGKPFHVNDLHIHPFSVSHDAADPVGFVVSNGQASLGYCTDTGMVSRLMRHRLSRLNGLILESNHDPEMLKNGPYPVKLQQRVNSRLGHLANQEAASFLSDIFHEELEHVVLAHLSETNNRPEIVRETFARVLNERNNGAGVNAFHFEDGSGADKSMRISLACQNEAGDLLKLNGAA